MRLRRILKSRWFYLAAGGLALVIALAVNWVINQWRLRTLYEQAHDLATFEATEAVRMLAERESRGATDVLIAVAVSPVPSYEARVAAIKALATRRGDQVSTSLAGLLKVDNGIDIRQAVSEVLLVRTCDYGCLLGVLAYLEKVWRGVPHVEDAFKTDRESKERIEGKQQKITNDLMQVLAKQRETVREILVSFYQLGSDDPHPFAIWVLEEAGISAACPEIRQSLSLVKDPSLQSELQDAIQQLACH